MKKILVFSVIIGTLFLLSACNNNAKEVKKVDVSASTQSEDKDETIKEEIATSDNFPTGFDYEKHFVIQSRTADSLIVEVSQEGFEFEELIYTIGAVKENGEWKIDTLDYRYNETADTSSIPGLVTEDEAREIVNNYLSSYKEYDVADITVMTSTGIR